MAKTDFLSWDTTPSNNTDIDSIGILGSNAVANFDNAFRTIMAQLRRDLDNGVVYTAKSSGYTAVANDNNGVLRFTASATLALTAAATLGTDWHITVVADGGDVTIDPNASETINGATTLVIANGSATTIICNGTAFFTTVRTSKPTITEITATGTYTKPIGCRYVIVEAIGGGGAGGGVSLTGASNAGAASGGASGFYGFTSAIDVTAIASGAVTIGAAGAAAAAGANNGGSGGDTTITLGATTYTWGGGPGGIGVTPSTVPRIPQLGGSPSGNNVRGSGSRNAANGYSDGANNFAQGGYGADSPFGTGGAAPRLTTTNNTNGGAAGATNYGAGGAGGIVVGVGSPAAGGNGAQGFMRIWEYY